MGPCGVLGGPMWGWGPYGSYWVLWGFGSPYGVLGGPIGGWESLWVLLGPMGF